MYIELMVNLLDPDISFIISGCNIMAVIAPNIIPVNNAGIAGVLFIISKITIVGAKNSHPVNWN